MIIRKPMKSLKIITENLVKVQAPRLRRNNYEADSGYGAFVSMRLWIQYRCGLVIMQRLFISSTSLNDFASYATSNSAAVGVNAYATNKGTSVGNNTQSANGVAIGYNATAGDFYKNLPGEAICFIQRHSYRQQCFCQRWCRCGTSASAEACGCCPG